MRQDTASYLQQAVCVRRKKKVEKKTLTNPPHRKHNREKIHSSPTTACNPRRHAMKHVPHASPYSPDSIDPEYVEIGLVQLSQSVKTTNSMSQTRTHTYRQTNKKIAPCTHPGTSREANEARWPHACSRPWVFEEKRNRIKKHGKIIRPTQNTPRNPHQPATASNSRPHTRKHVPRVSPYSPASIDPGFVEVSLLQLSQSVKKTNVTHTH